MYNNHWIFVLYMSSFIFKMIILQNFLLLFFTVLELKTRAIMIVWILRFSGTNLDPLQQKACTAITLHFYKQLKTN